MANIVRASSLERDPLKHDFKNFMWKTWKTLFNERPTDRMYEIGDRLQHGPDRDIVMGFRGVAKSYITVTYGVWNEHLDPHQIVLTVSGSGPGAKGNAFLAYSMITQFDWLSHLKPTRDQRYSNEAFDVAGANPTKSESFAAMSLFGQITGRRANLIIPDDVETPNTSSTEADRAELRRRYAELGGSILIPGGKIKVLGTSQTEQTIYKELAQSRGYGMYMLPAEYPIVDPSDLKRDELHRYGSWLSPVMRKQLEENPELAGTPSEPTRFPEADLMARRKEYGSTEYARQFKLFLDAGASDAKPFKLRDLLVMEIPIPTQGNPLQVPDMVSWGPLPGNRWEDIQVDSLDSDSSVFAPQTIGLMGPPEAVLLVIDPSGMGDDETSWKVLAERNAVVYLVHQDQRLEGFSKDTMRAIAEDAKRFGVNKIKIEKNYGGGMFGELLSPVLQEVGAACEIIEENAGSVQKEVRIIDTLQGIITGHALVVAARVLREDFDVSYERIEETKRRFYRLTYQLTRITKQRGCLVHDDRIDSLSSGCADFLGVLSRIRENAIQESRDAYLAAEAEKIIEARRKMGLAILGQTPQGSHSSPFLNRSVQGLRGSPYFANSPSSARK